MVMQKPFLLENIHWMHVDALGKSICCIKCVRSNASATKHQAAPKNPHKESGRRKISKFEHYGWSLFIILGEYIILF